MITIIAEDGTGKADANSYVTVAECDAYHDRTLNATTWTAASADDKAIAVVMATRLIDALFQFYGTITYGTQALQWPRIDCPDPDKNVGTMPSLSFHTGNMVDFNVVPQKVKDAACEMARSCLAGDRVSDPGWQGIKEMVVGGTAKGISFIFDKTDAAPIVPFIVQQTLSRFGGYVGKSSGQVKLTRS